MAAWRKVKVGMVSALKERLAAAAPERPDAATAPTLFISNFRHDSHTHLSNSKVYFVLFFSLLDI